MAESTSASSGLDHKTLQFLERLHHAWSTKASSSVYIEIRDELLLQRDRLDARVSALSTVARIACSDGVDVDAHWQELFTLARSIEEDGKKRKRSYQEANRFRNYVVVVALWSSQVVLHYGWDKVGQAQMYIVRACATQYPRFKEDLCPRLNRVLLERHRQGIRDGRLKTLNEVPIQPGRDLTLPALASAIPNLDEEGHWLTDESGNFSMEAGGPWLSQLRPNHFRSYLLEKDRFGVLVARDQGFLQQSHLRTACVRPSDTMIRHHVSLSHVPVNTLQNIGATAGGMFSVVEDQRTVDLQSLPVETSQALDFAPSTQLDPCMAVSSSNVLTPGEQFTWLESPRVLHHDRGGLDQDPSPLQISDSDSEIASWALSKGGSPPDHGTPTSDAAQSCHVISPRPETESWSDSNADSDCDPEPHTEANIETCHQTKKSSMHLAFKESAAPAMLSLQHGEAGKASFPPQRPKVATLRPVTYGLLERQGGQYSKRTGFTITSSSMESRAPETIEGVLQKRHYNMLAEYAARLVNETRRASAWQQRDLCAQWFNSDTKWASVWTDPTDELPRGTAISADEAEVLYYTSERFMTAARKGQIFRKPIVVKEKFTDSGMHTIDGFVSLLKDASSEAIIEVRRLNDRQPAAISVNEFAMGIRANRFEGANALNLRNITKAHRPLFTILSRFRLLESLVERTLGGYLGKKTMSTPVDVASCVEFNILGLTGAFSGAHLDSLCGTWVRNLSGVKFWMIVPDEDMELEWEAFVDAGCDWIPNEKQRLVLLEPDDVLLMPPGLKVVHAVHSPTNCLMEGGMFWDELNIVQTLQSVHWVCKNQATTNEAIAHQLPSIVDELAKLAKEQPDRFRGDMPKMEFLDTLEQAVLALRDLGCRCPLQDCDELCDCRQERRRCTAWCMDHTQVGHLICMEEVSTDHDEIDTDEDYRGV